MLTNRSGSLQTIASASAPHASAWPAAASRTRGGRRPCHRAEAVRAAGAGGGAAPLSAIEIEVAGRRVLAAWNSRLSRRARQLLSGERPANGGGPSSGGAASAGAACAAAALDLLAATVRAQAPEAPLSNPSSSEHTAPGVSGVSGTALGVLVPWAACPQALEPLLTHREVDATLVAVEPSYDGADAIQRRFGLLPPDGVAHDGWERFKPAGNASGGGAGSSTAGGGAGSSGAGGGGGGRVMLYRGSPYLLTPPVLSLATDVDAVWDRRARRWQAECRRVETTSCQVRVSNLPPPRWHRAFTLMPPLLFPAVLPGGAFC